MQRPLSADASNPAVLSQTLAALFPRGVVVAELREPGDPLLLLPGEGEHLARAVPERVQEFAAGRLCARRALGELGLAGFAVKSGPDRQPRWPEGFVGSITHTEDFCAAAAAPRSAARALGLDTEILGRVRRELWGSICVEEEIQWIESLAESERAAAATLIFAAKEAFYKGQYPLTGEWLGFHDAHVQVPIWAPADDADGAPDPAPRQVREFQVSPRRDVALSASVSFPLIGLWRIHGRHVSAALTVAAG